MVDLERLELALWRIHAKRQKAFEADGSVLNIDIQKFIEELATELGSVARGRKETTGEIK